MTHFPKTYLFEQGQKSFFLPTGKNSTGVQKTVQT